MKANETQYDIYIKGTGNKVPVTEEQFKDYYRGIDSYRRTQQKRGQCVCPQAKRLLCNMDCMDCEFRRSGTERELDRNTVDESGNASSWLDRLQLEMPELQQTDIAEKVEQSMYMQNILERLEEIMPIALEIGHLRENGLSDCEIEKRIGIGRKTFAYQLKRAKKILEKEFPDLF